MTTCLGKSCSFGLLCVSYVNVYRFFVCPPFPFGIEGGMWHVIVSILDHCPSIYFAMFGLQDSGRSRKKQSTRPLLFIKYANHDIQPSIITSLYRIIWISLKLQVLHERCLKEVGLKHEKMYLCIERYFCFAIFSLNHFCTNYDTKCYSCFPFTQIESYWSDSEKQNWIIFIKILKFN